MGLFEGMKDTADLTKQAKEMQAQQQEQAGYKPGLGGQMAQMGDMLSQANQRLGELTDQQGDQGRLLAEGLRGEAVIVATGTPARGAAAYDAELERLVKLRDSGALLIDAEFEQRKARILGG